MSAEHYDPRDGLMYPTDPGWRDDGRFGDDEPYGDMLEPAYDDLDVGPPIRVLPHVDTILAEADAAEWRMEEGERFAHPAERPVRNRAT